MFSENLDPFDYYCLDDDVDFFNIDFGQDSDVFVLAFPAYHEENFHLPNRLEDFDYV